MPGQAPHVAGRNASRGLGPDRAGRVRTRLGGGAAVVPCPARPAPRRRDRSAAAGAAAARHRAGPLDRAVRRPPAEVDHACDGRRSPPPVRSLVVLASGPRRSRARVEGPGRPPRGRVRGGRHGRSGPGWTSSCRPGDPGPAFRRRRPPAGPWCVPEERSNQPSTQHGDGRSTRRYSRLHRGLLPGRISDGSVARLGAGERPQAGRISRARRSAASSVASSAMTGTSSRSSSSWVDGDADGSASRSSSS